MQPGAELLQTSTEPLQTREKLMQTRAMSFHPATHQLPSF